LPLTTLTLAVLPLPRLLFLPWLLVAARLMVLAPLPVAPLLPFSLVAIALVAIALTAIALVAVALLPVALLPVARLAVPRLALTRLTVSTFVARLACRRALCARRRWSRRSLRNGRRGRRGLFGRHFDGDRGSGIRGFCGFSSLVDVGCGLARRALVGCWHETSGVVRSDRWTSDCWLTCDSGVQASRYFRAGVWCAREALRRLRLS